MAQPQSVGLFRTKDQPVAETSTWQHTQHSQQINIHTPGGIRIRNLSKRTAVDTRPYTARPLGSALLGLVFRNSFGCQLLANWLGVSTYWQRLCSCVVKVSTYWQRLCSCVVKVSTYWQRLCSCVVKVSTYSQRLCSCVVKVSTYWQRLCQSKSARLLSFSPPC
jgi:hypothetical protein